MSLRRARRIGMLVAALAVDLTLSPAIASAGRPGARMANEKEWREAEAVAVAHARAKWKAEPVEVIRHARVPYLFQVDFPTAGEAVLVRDGKVFEGRGLPALGEVLRAVGLPAHGDLKAEDLTRLVVLLQAFPPVQGAAPDAFHTDPHLAHKKLLPTLTRKGGVARYRICYLLRPGSTADLPAAPAGAPAGVPVHGGPANPNAVDVSEWTLTITADQPPAWSEARYRWDARKQRRVD